MKNPNSYRNRLKTFLKERWSKEDFPDVEPRFQITLLSKDIFVFVCLPMLAIFLFKSCELAMNGEGKKRQPKLTNNATTSEATKSQIITFSGGASGTSSLGVARVAPGSLVRVRLLNVVETYSNAPVHVQILDTGLGRNFVGSTLVGDAVSNEGYRRIDITFRYLRDHKKASQAFPISARALSLDGTLGINANKKEGFFARATLNSAAPAAQNFQGGADANDFKNLIVKALTAGLVQEFGASSQVERNRAQVLTLRPPAEFFVELTDYFPGTGR